MEVFLLILRLALAAVFGIAGAAKLFDPAGSEKAFDDFGVAKVLVKPLVYLLPAAEILIAVSLLFTQSSWYGAVGGASLLFIFSAGMLYQMAKGNAPDCHCFGQIHSEPVGLSSVLRNGILLGLAAFLAAPGTTFQGLSIVNSNQDIMQFILGIAVIMVLLWAVMYLRRISEQQTQIMRQIELMELVARDGGSVERDDAGHPHEGLPIGAPVPNFELPDASGDIVTLADLRTDRRPILFFFVSPTCNPCDALVPEFEQWQADLADKVKLVFVSNGSPEDNLEKFGGEAEKLILLQLDREVAEALKAQWTPTAVLMDKDGRIASHVAAGDIAIRGLVDQIKYGDPDKEFNYFLNGNGHNHSHNKIGNDIPDFSLEAIDGQEINKAYFEGKQTLVAFWSMTCPHCQNMMDDLREWDNTKRADEPALVVFSDGDKASHEEIGLVSPIILEEGHKTAIGFGMFGTPSAVLVNEEGKIVSETAVGAPDIWSLVGKRK